MKFICLHGLAGDPGDWDGVKAALPHAHFHTPRIDYFDESHQSMVELAEKIRAELPPAFAVPETVLVGNSLGGVLSLSLGEAFRRVVLVSSHIETGAQYMLGRTKKSFEAELKRVFHKQEALTEEQIKGYETMWLDYTRSRKKVAQMRRIKKNAQ